MLLDTDELYFRSSNKISTLQDREGFSKPSRCIVQKTWTGGQISSIHAAKFITAQIGYVEKRRK